MHSDGRMMVKLDEIFEIVRLLIAERKIVHSAPVMALTAEQRARWATCPDCNADHGEFCRSGGELIRLWEVPGKTALYVHKARFAASPAHVRMVPALRFSGAEDQPKESSVPLLDGIRERLKKGYTEVGQRLQSEYPDAAADLASLLRIVAAMERSEHG